MQILGIHHVAFAHRPDDEVAGKLYDVLGLSVTHEEEAEGFVERMIPVGAGGSYLQTLECVGPGTVARFVERRGSALHHMALLVEDLDSALAELRAAGRELIDEVARPGGADTRIAFIHPAEFAGLLVELVEEPR